MLKIRKNIHTEMQRYKAYANYGYSGDDPHVCELYGKSLLQNTIVHNGEKTSKRKNCGNH